MSSVVDDVKSQVRVQLEAALKDLEGTTCFSDIHDALDKVTDMCVGLDRMYRSNTMEAVMGAVGGNWASIRNFFSDDC